MVLTLLNYQSPRYRGPQNEPDSVTQQIIGWQSVWGFFDIPRNKGGKFLKNLWFCVFQIGTHNPRGINVRFSSKNLFDNWKYFCCFHAPGRYKKNISDFLKASHTLLVDISRTFWPIFMKIQEIYKRHKFI